MHDVRFVELYRLTIDRNLGKFVGFGSRCVILTECRGDRLDSSGIADNRYAQAVRQAQAQERVRDLRAI